MTKTNTLSVFAVIAVATIMVTSSIIPAYAMRGEYTNTITEPLMAGDEIPVVLSYDGRQYVARLLVSIDGMVNVDENTFTGVIRTGGVVSDNSESSTHFAVGSDAQPLRDRLLEELRSRHVTWLMHSTDRAIPDFVADVVISVNAADSNLTILSATLVPVDRSDYDRSG